MKLLLFAASTLATNNESLFSVDDNGMGDVWCDVAYADCITNKATTLCGLKKNREIGLRALCIPHCGYRFADDKKFKNHCKDHLPEDFRSVSHCPPGGCQSSYLVDPIWNYGCWCNFGQNLLEGQGGPVNRVDNMCRNLQLCLRCARWDGKNDPNPYTCDPSTQSYSGVQVGSHFVADCSVGNDPNHCASHVCSCNFHFIVSLFSLIFDNSYQYDDSYLHSNGFNSSQQCFSDPTGAGQTSCCGYYPHRHPYNTNSEYKQCCDEHFLYNPMEQCCDGGEVHPIGTCI